MSEHIPLPPEEQHSPEVGALYQKLMDVLLFGEGTSDPAVVLSALCHVMADAARAASVPLAEVIGNLALCAGVQVRINVVPRPGPKLHDC